MSQFPINAGYALFVRRSKGRYAFCALLRDQSEAEALMQRRLESLWARGAQPMEYLIVECCATVTHDQDFQVS